MIKIRNITFSANEDLIEKAREKAKKEGKALNTKFREWIRKYIAPQDFSNSYKEVMNSLKHITPGRKFSRDEANQR